MDSHGLSEQEAFSFIQTTAMQERQTMKAISERVIADELVPPAS
jgi:AmiR/NasT family two-component response regulator